MNYERLYEYRFRDIDQDSRTAVWGEIAPFISKVLGDPEVVLDPAAGRGEFINAVPARERWAVDMVAYPEGTHAPGTEVIVSDIFDAELPQHYFEGVWISNFLEHLLSQEQVATFLEKMHSCLKPGGKIAVMGPNFRYCSRDYFDCADHTLIFTHGAVAEHLYAAGFEPELVVPRFLPYSFRSKLPPSVAGTRRYLKTPLAWRLLGKQFLVVARA
jgi:SAM-dependent methyltransferase